MVFMFFYGKVTALGHVWEFYMSFFMRALLPCLCYVYLVSFFPSISLVFVWSAYTSWSFWMFLGLGSDQTLYLSGIPCMQRGMYVSVFTRSACFLASRCAFVLFWALYEWGRFPDGLGRAFEEGSHVPCWAVMFAKKG
ncbi:hypothetical protein PSV09DRAFT_2274070 [Bipolaris maydis]|uniref:uncharacterized protein n=1 Tax=Cochliobolus heterostrophus TaxID=5016 RepID=UPI0024D638DB|nr:hypothetical protein J3E73DRAFT_280220 [Bipolaris maydis]KAJ5065845.1 hypothetical protein J3E74DRAFT_305441 [Bipolaris maydis]KAJ6213090.1 hypothetical protein PSV09DRAFT_2274070 [Bipolaris maydis]KAJ6274340.1 hypothetical protein PSV08DRAFT_263419 [Bipolaris maydis]KAJ6286376.1 hypothetical protein J3E71DRAFT_262864 [Bipolaris maydis]